MAYSTQRTERDTSRVTYLPLRLPMEDRFVRKREGGQEEKEEQEAFEMYELDWMREEDLPEACALFADVVEEGLSWPFEEVLSMEAFKGYFHVGFVVRLVSRDGSRRSDIAGMFYVKPNFPGRCNLTANSGFVTNPMYRQRGVGTFMGKCFLRLARDLGFECSLFNLVFVTNTASVRLWRRLGFTQTGRIPKVARLKGIPERVDALQFHYDFSTLPEDGALITSDAFPASSATSTVTPTADAAPAPCPFKTFLLNPIGLAAASAAVLLALVAYRRR